MRSHKKEKYLKHVTANARVRSWEILCEECGAIYDARTSEGLCQHCARGEATNEQGASSAPAEE